MKKQKGKKKFLQWQRKVKKQPFDSKVSLFVSKKRRLDSCFGSMQVFPVFFPRCQAPKAYRKSGSQHDKNRRFSLETKTSYKITKLSLNKKNSTNEDLSMENKAMANSVQGNSSSGNSSQGPKDEKLPVCFETGIWWMLQLFSLMNNTSRDNWCFFDRRKNNRARWRRLNPLWFKVHVW